MEKTSYHRPNIDRVNQKGFTIEPYIWRFVPPPPRSVFYRGWKRVDNGVRDRPRMILQLRKLRGEGVLDAVFVGEFHTLKCHRSSLVLRLGGPTPISFCYKQGPGIVSRQDKMNAKLRTGSRPR